MGLAFWGGFASGMSKSIEKNRDRTAKRKKLDDAALAADKKALNKQNKDIFELGKTTKEAFMEINERISKIKSGDISLSEAEAVDEVNYLTNQKLDMYTRAMDYGITLNVKDPRMVIDIGQEDIGQIGVFSDGAERYIVNKELGDALDNNNGEIRLGSNGEIERWKTTQNSQGAWIPEKHENGEFVYESTGEFLQKTSDVFMPKAKTSRATSLEQDKQAYLDMKEARIKYQENPTDENRENLNFASDVVTKRTRGTGEAGERSEKGDAKAAIKYGKSIIGDISTYDYDESYDTELDFRYTDMYNKNVSLKKDEEKFNTELISFNRNKGLFDVFDKAVKDGSYKSGILEKVENTLTAYTTKEFTDFIGLDREEIKTRLGLEGQLGDGVATYLKGLSGTAASQAEFVRTVRNFVGRDMTQEDIKQTVFENFIAKKSRDMDVSAKSLARRGLVNTGGSWLARNTNQKQDTNVATEIVGGVEYETKVVDGKKQYKNPEDGKWYK